MGYDFRFERPRNPALAERPDLPHDGRWSEEDWERYGAWEDARGYFRIGIFSMGEYRGRMATLGMLDLENDHPAWSEGEAHVLESQPSDRIPIYKLSSNDGWLVTPDEIRGSLSIYDVLSPRAVLAAGAMDTATDFERSVEKLFSYFAGATSASPDISTARVDGSPGFDITYWHRWIAYLREAIEYGGIRVD